MPTDPKRVKEIFLEAAEQPNEVACAAFLDRACEGDAELRTRVEALLRSHDPDGSFLGTPVAAIPDPDRADTRHFAPNADHASTRTSDGTSRDDEISLTFMAPPGRPDSLGRIGHYEVLEILGQGGFGIVFRAFDDVLQRVVAVKVLAPQLAAASPARKRFLREARTSAQVRHENVVQVYEIGEIPLPYLVMEFIPGETLQQRLDRIGPVDPPEVVRIGRQIAEGLAAAHANDLIHRDIKPGNILLEGGHQKVKITDFGLARAADDASISQSGIIAGTPMYMSPEQAKGDKLDHRTDLFSLGSVLYQMASGRAPFRANTTLAVMKRVAEDAPRPIREIIPETPQWLCDIISKLHAKNPDERFQSAREVADLLAECEAKLKAGARLSGFTPIPQSKPAAAPAEMPPVAPSGRWKSIVAAVILLPVIALAATESIGVTHLFRPPPNALPSANRPEDQGQQPFTQPGPIPTQNGNQRPDAGTPKTPTTAPQGGTPPWTVVKPIEMKSESGASLTLQADNSILVSGKQADKDSYTLTFRAIPTTTVQALRLEVLPHDSLPNNGPGRHPNLGFVLSTVRVAIVGNKGQPRELKIASAWADHSTGDDSTPPLAIDADDNTGWCAEFGKPHYLVLELAEPITLADGASLRVTLEFKHADAQRTLGCFRMSVVEDLTADRKAAEYVLSLGGLVKVNDLAEEIQVATALPPIPFRLTYANLWEKQTTTVEGLAVFKNCKYLKELELHRSNITDAGLAHFKNCKDLSFLNLTGTPITNAGLAVFKDSKNLLHLTLAETKVTDEGLAYFKDCKELKELWLYFTQVTDGGVAHFKDCKNLTSINLHGTPITNAGLAYFKDRENLTIAHLSAMQVTDAGLAHIKNCKNLTLLNLADTAQITDAGLTHLTGLDKLTDLSLTNTKVTAKGVEGLAKALPRCKIIWTGGTIEAIDFDRKAAETVLSLGGSVRVNGDEREIKAVAELPKTPFQLTHIELGYRPTTASALAVFKECRNLTRLALGGDSATDEGIAHFKGCTSLVEINFHDNTLVTDAGLAHFKDCKNLIHLDLSNASKVSDAGLLHFKDCKNLQVLFVYGTKVTNAGLEHFKHWKELRDIYLDGLPVTDAGLAHLAGLDKLASIILTGTKVTAKGIEGLKKALPNCHIKWDGGVIEPKPNAPALPVSDADRKGAEYALSIGGEIKVNAQGPVVKAAADLPRDAFRLTWVGLPNNTKVTDAGLAVFKDCKNLGGLQLEGTPITDAGIVYLKDCVGLTGLDLTNTKVTDAGLTHFKDFQGLTFLQLAGTQTTDTGLANFRGCKNLMHLSLDRTQVGDAGLALFKDAKNLTTLYLDATLITDASLAYLSGLDQLIELKLTKTKVTASGIETLAKTLPKCKITWDSGVIAPK